MLVEVVAIVVVVAKELLVEVFGAAVEFDSMEILASVIVESLCSASNVKKDAAGRKTDCCKHAFFSLDMRSSVLFFFKANICKNISGKKRHNTAVRVAQDLDKILHMECGFWFDE